MSLRTKIPTTTHEPYAGLFGFRCLCANCLHVSGRTHAQMQRHDTIDADLMLRNAHAFAFGSMVSARLRPDLEPQTLGCLPAGAIEVNTETAYGSTVRLSRSVRVF